MLAVTINYMMRTRPGDHLTEDIQAMANAPVPVKPTFPAMAGSTDVVRSLRTEMDRLFDRFTGGFSLFPFQTGAVPSPAVDITEDDTAFKVSVELPGMTEKDVEVSLTGNTLSIRGEKRQEKEEKDKGYHLSERSYGMFQRSFILPDGVDPDKLNASCTNGVLTVTAPKSAQAAPKKIEVKATA